MCFLHMFAQGCELSGIWTAGYPRHLPTIGRHPRDGNDYRSVSSSCPSPRFDTRTRPGFQLMSDQSQGQPEATEGQIAETLSISRRTVIRIKQRERNPGLAERIRTS